MGLSLPRNAPPARLDVRLFLLACQNRPDMVQTCPMAHIQVHRRRAADPSILKHVPNGAFKPVAKLFKGLQGDVLIPQLKPV